MLHFFTKNVLVSKLTVELFLFFSPIKALMSVMILVHI